MTRTHVSTTNQSNLAKNWLQCASNRGIQSMSVTNSAFLLAYIATPINKPSQCIMYTDLVFSARAQQSAGNFWGRKVPNLHEFHSFTATCRSFLHEILGVHTHYAISLMSYLDVHKYRAAATKIPPTAASSGGVGGEVVEFWQRWAEEEVWHLMVVWRNLST